ncbi:ABC transporter domain-containing protein [Haematococcus lacustris]|uniref:ABC transporter domain-containing protein n=1 Tax=Haematococcus lacustris TaxID=44745 RepID=A0A699YLV3_HAELA|nr:ABC transporter domain-containing protein [Haematococcus lacustris]
MEVQSINQAVAIAGVQFAYPSSSTPFIKDCDIDLPRGSRCLLIGANGAGKTTLLQIVAGKYMVGQDMVRILGRPPFHDTALTCSGQLSYLGTSWRKDVAFAGYGVPLQGDISAGKMIFGVEGVDPVRRARLITLLDIDLYQRVNTMSDGQRRRVQICMGLLKPYDVLLLDEITVDLDVVGRLQLLDFFRAECEERGATILYATHIFDGLEGWITHLAYMEDGKLVKSGPVTELAEVAAVQQGQCKLLHVVERWLEAECQSRHARQAALKAAGGEQGSNGSETTIKPNRTPVSMPSKHLAFFR